MRTNACAPAAASRLNANKLCEVRDNAQEISEFRRQRKRLLQRRTSKLSTANRVAVLFNEPADVWEPEVVG